LITRVTRGVLDRDKEAEVIAYLRTAADARPVIPGLVGFVLSRAMDERSVVLVSISLWTDIDTMAASLGPNWRQPSWPGLNEHMKDASVEIFETIATSTEGLMKLEPSG